MKRLKFKDFIPLTNYLRFRVIRIKTCNGRWTASNVLALDNHVFHYLDIKSIRKKDMRTNGSIVLHLLNNV
jgi:hypothetical protein